MRFEQAWSPSIFAQRDDGTWTVSLDPANVAPSSRVQVAVGAGAYADACAKYARGDLLDLGCGRVPLYGMYRSRVRTVVCTDWPNSQHVSPHLDFYCDLTKSLPLRAESFDTVVLTDVLEHLPYPDLALSEVRRVLRPGGHVIIGVPFMYGVHEAPHDYHRYTEYRLRMLCEENGLDPVAVRAHGGAWAVWWDLTMKMLARLPAGRWISRVASRLALWSTRMATGDGETTTPSGYTVVARSH